MDNMDKKAQLKLPNFFFLNGNSCMILLLDALFCNIIKFFLKVAFLFVFQCLHSKNGNVCMQLL